jgi:hypothetical protein
MQREWGGKSDLLEERSVRLLRPFATTYEFTKPRKGKALRGPRKVLGISFDSIYFTLWGDSKRLEGEHSGLPKLIIQCL